MLSIYIKNSKVYLNEEVIKVYPKDLNLNFVNNPDLLKDYENLDYGIDKTEVIKGD